jgi:hypothetical protein
MLRIEKMDRERNEALRGGHGKERGIGWKILEREDFPWICENIGKAKA